MFMLVSRRYERASMIVTSNKPFSGWGEIFGDDLVAAAMIDRLVHHAEIVALKGDNSYRLRDRELAALNGTTEQNSHASRAQAGRLRRPGHPRSRTRPKGCIFNRREGVHLQPAV
jgi:IstB-like ATP binding protein